MVALFHSSHLSPPVWDLIIFHVQQVGREWGPGFKTPNDSEGGGEVTNVGWAHGEQREDDEISAFQDHKTPGFLSRLSSRPHSPN